MVVRVKAKKTLSLFLAVVMLITSLGIQNVEAKAAETGTNLALGKTVTASSVESAVPTNTPDKAVDGKISNDNRWSCNAMKPNGEVSEDTQQTAQWLVIDLEGEEFDISEIKVSYFKKVWAAKYQIQTADTNTAETEWETVKEVERASGSLSDNPTDTFTDVTLL